MAGFIQNILWNSVEGFVDAAKKTGGEYAGNALIKAGDMIEGGGRSVGNGIEKTATGYGSKLSGQTYQASSASKALPSTARKPVVKRSNSMPANTKPSGSVAGGRSIAGPTSGVPLGAKKTVGGAKKAVGGVTGTASRTVGGVTGGANRAVGGVAGGATRGVGGVVGGASKSVNGIVGGASKTAGGAIGRGSKPLGGVVNNATKGLGGITSNAQKAVPKPYSSTSAGSSYTNPYPSAKKAPVKPGMNKPFTPPASTAGDPKPYPGTNTLPGQGSKAPVRRRYAPAPTLGSQVAPGQKMTHIGAF
ncbi:hypothetical protein N0V95_000241 [Ascochyta clinopodiicola]|nr:hypothetical protein N0V95_000241 [Ascochyta clinopodiicola]